MDPQRIVRHPSGMSHGKWKTVDVIIEVMGWTHHRQIRQRPSKLLIQKYELIYGWMPTENKKRCISLLKGKQRHARARSASSTKMTVIILIKYMRCPNHKRLRLMMSMRMRWYKSDDLIPHAMIHSHCRNEREHTHHHFIFGHTYMMSNNREPRQWMVGGSWGQRAAEHYARDDEDWKERWAFRCGLMESSRSLRV